MKYHPSIIQTSQNITQAALKYYLNITTNILKHYRPLPHNHKNLIRKPPLPLYSLLYVELRCARQKNPMSHRARAHAHSTSSALRAPVNVSTMTMCHGRIRVPSRHWPLLQWSLCATVVSVCHQVLVHCDNAPLHFANVARPIFDCHPFSAEAFDCLDCCL